MYTFVCAGRSGPAPASAVFHLIFTTFLADCHYYFTALFLKLIMIRSFQHLCTQRAGCLCAKCLKPGPLCIGSFYKKYSQDLGRLTKIVKMVYNGF